MTSNSITRSNRWPQLALIGLVCVLGLVLTTHFLREKKIVDDSPKFPNPATTSVQGTSQSSSAAQRPSVAITVAGQVTFDPGSTKQLKQLIPGAVIAKKTPSWWLYARSADEAQWLDRFGYPTPKDEARLLSSSDADLKNLAEAGDVNARINLLTRPLKGVMVSQDIRDAEIAINSLPLDLLLRHPYASAKAMAAIDEVMTQYQKIPDDARTPQQNKIAIHLARAYEEAYVIAMAYGDYTANMSYSPRRGANDKRLFERSSFVAGDLALLIANSSRIQVEKGLPPLTFYPRPAAPGGTGLGFSDDGKGVVLERQ